MEHEHTVERIREGIAKAKSTEPGPASRSAGCRARCRPALKKHYLMRKKGEITATDFAKAVGVSRPTLYIYIKDKELEMIII